MKGVGCNLNPETTTMIRIVTIAALAATLAAPAMAGESIRIATAGKSPEQLKAEVTMAARKLCVREIAGATFPIQELDSCRKRTVTATLAQMQDPDLKLATR